MNQTIRAYLSFFLALLIQLCVLSATLMAAPKHVPSPLDGKTIRSITIKVNDIFEQANPRLLYRAANGVKVNTKEHVIRQELLFKEGDIYDEFHIRESERRLRDLRYLRNITITANPDGDSVDLVVNVQDTWTLIPQLSFSSGTGRKSRSAGVAESNILGLGKRVEASYSEDEARQIIEGVYEDNRFLGSQNRLLGAYFQRNDGYERLLYYGRPFRSLVDKSAWYMNVHDADTVGILYKDGTENYIFRQKNLEYNFRLTTSRGDPETLIQRYSIGYDYIEDQFSQATEADYEDLNLDPNTVSNDPSRLAQDRLFTGPVLSYQFIRPQFISMNYIDRFDRVEDYNLGTQYDLSSLFAPDILGSSENAMIFSSNASRGYQFNYGAFVRGELGLSSRFNGDSFSNTLFRGEAKYYHVLGDLSFKELWLGKHTFASSAFFDFGSDLDPDRQLTLGGDNGLRGYKARTFTGDKRLAINIEDRIHLVDDLFRIVSFGSAFFFEVGGATSSDFGSIISDGLYADVGAGLRFAFPRSSGGRVLRLDLAFPLRSGPDGSNAFELRVIVQGGQLFGSRLRSETLGPERANVSVGFDR